MKTISTKLRPKHTRLRVPGEVPERRLGEAAEAGFTLIEAVVTLGISVGLLAMALFAFDYFSEFNRVQNQVVDLQQSQRIAHYTLSRLTRMAGRGGLPASDAGRSLPQGIALEVRDGVGVSGGGRSVYQATSAPLVVEGTDVLVLRGVLSNPIYQINSANPSSLTLDSLPPALPTRGTIVVHETSPSGVPQSLAPLVEVIDRGLPEALLLVSPLDDSIYAVVELDPAASSFDEPPTEVTLAFRVSGGSYTTQYLALSPGGSYPAALTRAAFVGLLEEYRYYVREEYLLPGDATSEPRPTLARARMYPGTETPWGDDPQQGRQDLAAGVVDFQVALGLDSSYQGSFADDSDHEGPDDAIAESAEGDEDDWLFNGPDDDATDPTWANAQLYYVRFTTLIQTLGRDPNFRAPVVQQIENREYPAGTELNAASERMRRRSRLESIVDLRNL